MPLKEGLSMRQPGEREPVNNLRSSIRQHLSISASLCQHRLQASRQNRVKAGSGSKGTHPTRAEDLQEGYDYVPDLAPDNMPYSNKDERDGDPDYQESDRSESESELDGVNSDAEDQRRYNEIELPIFNCNAPRVPPPQSNGDSDIGSNAQAIVNWPSKWWRVVSVKAS
jgi:hypothetical protein